jgi:RNA polymerase sigma-70 factor (ECF subfamily)
MQAPSSETMSSSLLRRAKQGDSDAWDRLSSVYGPLVYQWCRRAGLQVSDAGDVGQEVFHAVSTHLQQYQAERADATFRGWLWTITRNKIRDHFRSKGREVDGAGGTDAQRRLQQIPAAPPCPPDDASGSRAQSSLARRATDLMQADFEPTTWQAFWLTAVEGRSAKSAGEQLGLSTSAVYMARSRVLRRLRDELDGLELID